MAGLIVVGVFVAECTSYVPCLVSATITTAEQYLLLISTHSYPHAPHIRHIRAQALGAHPPVLRPDGMSPLASSPFMLALSSCILPLDVFSVSMLPAPHASTARPALNFGTLKWVPRAPPSDRAVTQRRFEANYTLRDVESLQGRCPFSYKYASSIDCHSFAYPLSHSSYLPASPSPSVSYRSL